MKLKNWLIKITKWEQKSPHERKGYLARIIGSTVFFIAGIVVGIIALYLNGWDLYKFITNPTTDFIILVCIALGIILLTYHSNNKETL